MFNDTRGGQWMIRWQVGDVEKKIHTAHPLPQNERSAAKIHALHDLRHFTQRPNNPELVWVENSGKVLETHPLN